jgi:iron-sulfur cluster repair protein YtfE (RIC family)
MDSPSAAPSVPKAAAGSVEQLIGDEHFAIRAHLTELRELATVFLELDRRDASRRAEAVLDFFTNELLPHAAAEEGSLYPMIDRLVGAGATLTMALDHEAIADVIAQLGVAANGDVDPSARGEVQRLLFVLEALLTTHLWKEDTAYVPLLAGPDSHAYTALHAEVAGHTARANTSTERAAIR